MCRTNLILFFEEVTKRIDKGRGADIVYIDFSKVLHGRLIWKFGLYRIQGELANWIQNWLGDGIRGW